MIAATEDCGCVPGKITHGHPKCFESHSPEETRPRYNILRCQTTAPPPSCPYSNCCRPFRCSIPVNCPPMVPPCPMTIPSCPMTKPSCPKSFCPQPPCPMTKSCCPPPPCPPLSCQPPPCPPLSCQPPPCPPHSCQPPPCPPLSCQPPPCPPLSCPVTKSCCSPNPCSVTKPPCPPPPCPPPPCPPPPCLPPPCPNTPSPCLNFDKLRNCTCSPEPPVLPDLPDDCACGFEENDECKITPEGECDPCSMPKEDKLVSNIAKKGQPYKEIEAIINNNRMVIRMQKEPVEEEFEPPCECPEGPGLITAKGSSSKVELEPEKGCGDEIVYEMSDFAKPGYTTGGQSSLVRHSCEQKGQGGRTITMYPHPGIEHKTSEDPEDKERERKEKRAHDKYRTIRPIDLEENPNIFVLRIRKISNTSEGKQKFDLEFRTPRPWLKREKMVKCPAPVPPAPLCQLPSPQKPKAKRRCAKGKKKKSKKK